MWSGFFMGLALATKWSALYFLLLFALVALYRAFTHHTGKEMITPTLRRIVAFAIIPFTTYIASWAGWLISHRGWDRSYSSNIITSFIHYHQQMLNFHTSLTEKHNYQANPWVWMIQGRPTSFFYDTPKSCGASSCSREVLALGTPLLWWAATIAVVIVLGLWIKSAAIRAFEPALNIITIGIVAGYLPWFFFQKRTVFSFYAIAFEPFVILALVYCTKLFMDSQRRKGEQSYRISLAVVATCVVIIALNFMHFLPVFMGSTITYDHWYSLMWLESWI
jgi:dolichyl-phosphate-mannose--protein O-mannosyl transferase